MKLSWQMSVALLFCALLSACDLDAPTLTSAKASIYQAAQPLRSWQLTRAQLASLEAWLVQHRTGWDPDMATYEPRVLITATAADGSAWSINVLGTVVAVVRGQTKLKQSFARTEIDALVAAIGVSQ
jgi:hypothetical protein